MLTIEQWNQRGVGYLPGLIGLEIVEIENGRVRARLPIRPELLAPNGYLHAASVIGLADTACGYGTMASRPQGAVSFATIELKTNFLGTTREGAIACEAKLLHGGRTTQIWDAEVKDEGTGKAIALFRCTQMLIYPREQ